MIDLTLSCDGEECDVTRTLPVDFDGQHIGALIRRYGWMTAWDHSEYAKFKREKVLCPACVRKGGFRSPALKEEASS